MRSCNRTGCKSSRILLFDCQNLISTPPRSNALLTIYPSTRATDFAQRQPDRLATRYARLCRYANCQDNSKCGVHSCSTTRPAGSKPPPPHCPNCAQAMRLAERRDGSMVYPTCTYLNAERARCPIPRRHAAKRNRTQDRNWLLVSRRVRQPNTRNQRTRLAARGRHGDDAFQKAMLDSKGSARAQDRC